MKILFTILVILCFVPSVVTATQDCVDVGYSVIYVNGILTDFNSADESKEEVEGNFLDFSKYASSITTYLGHNPTRTSIIDIPKTILQAAWREDTYQALDLDATNILKNVHGDIKTKKILLLGHSQGTFYTNQLYHYLINNGVSKEAIAVYNIGTPASYVSGGGKYITNSTDGVINAVRRGAKTGLIKPPLAPNTHIAIEDDNKSDSGRGHSLQGVYLAGEGERIVGEIDSLLGSLKAPASTSGSQDGGCFDKPKESLQAMVEDMLMNSPKVILAINTMDLAVNAAQLVNSKLKIAKDNMLGLFAGRTAYKSTKQKIKTEQLEDRTIIQPSTVQGPVRQEIKTPATKTLSVPKQAVQPTLTEVDLQRLLALLQEMLEARMLATKPPSKCAGIDLTILKFSTCLSPFEEGGYAWGAGAASGIVAFDSGPDPDFGGDFIGGGGPPPPDDVAPPGF